MTRQSLTPVAAARGARGSALIISIVVIGIVLGMSATLLALASAETRVTGGARDDLQVRFIAESGLHEAVAYARLRGGSDAISTIASAITSDMASARALAGGTWTALASVTQTSYIVVTARASLRQTTRRVEGTILVQPPQPKRFRHAAYSGERVFLDTGSRTDSWDSSLETVATQFADGLGRNNGNIASAERLRLRNGSLVRGSGRYGPAPDGSSSVGGGSTITGTVVQDNSLTKPPTIKEPVIPATTSLSLGGTSAQTVGPGSVGYSSVLLRSSANLTIVGPATVWVPGDFDMDDSARLTINATNGPVNIMVGGWFDIDGGNLVSVSSGRPRDLRLWMTENNPYEVDIQGVFPGVIYHGGTGASYIYSGGRVYGAVIGSRDQDIQLYDDGRIYYDESLSTTDIVCPTDEATVTLVSWRELP